MAINALHLVGLAGLILLTAGANLRYGALIAVFGVALIPYVVISAVFGFTLLETVNYLEHYGLLRQKLESGRYERCAVTPPPPRSAPAPCRAPAGGR